MQYKILFLFTFFMAFGQIVIGQTVNENDTSKLPEIVYSNANPKYEIAEITITGADNYEDFGVVLTRLWVNADVRVEWSMPPGMADNL